MTTPNISWRFIFLIAPFLGLPCYGQTIRGLSEVYKVEDTQGVDIEIDIEVTVNFWDPKRHWLFVQEDDAAIYVKLPRHFYDNPPGYLAGTQVRIKGSFLVSSHTIEAREIEITGQGKAVTPTELDIATATPGAYWSRRVKVSGTVESVLLGDGHIQMVVQRGASRFYVRRLASPEFKLPDDIIGATVDFTGTLASLVDSKHYPYVFICHQMPADAFEIQARGRTLPTPTLIKDFSDDSATDDLESIEVSGQVSYMFEYDYIVVEDKDYNVMRVYAPFAGGIELGDVVRIVGEPSSIAALDRSLHSPIREDHDLRGEGTELFARFVHHQYESLPRPPPSVPILDLLAKDSAFFQRARVEAQLVSYQIEDGVWRLQVSDGERILHVRVPISDKETSPDLNRAKQLEISGIMFPSKTVAGQIVLHASSPADLVVLERWPGVDRRTAGLVIGLLLVALAAGTILVLSLRNQVGNKDKHLASVFARLNSSYDAINEAVLVVDTEGHVVGKNSRVEDVLCVSDVDLAAPNDRGIDGIEQLGLRLASGFASGDFIEFWRRMNQAESGVEQVELETSSAPPRSLIVYSAPVIDESGETEARIWTFNDISARKQLEEELLQSQKMEAVGRLAGGVAHDFNNLLLAMMANLELARFRPEITVAEASEYIDAAEEAAQRAAKLVRHLLGFSRKTRLDKKVTSLNDVVRDADGLFLRMIESNVVVELELHTDLWHTKIDRTQVEQVLLNICINARDALAGKPGTISVVTENIASELLTATRLERTSPVQDYVRVSISDDGEGIPAEIGMKIFEPFFTTKPPGKGTGLGLATSLGIIQQHDGQILFDSTVGEGSRFEIYLPRCTEDAALPDAASPGTALPDAASPGTASPDAGEDAKAMSTSLNPTVMVVEDESIVLESTSKALRMRGFNVVRASNGREALSQLEANKVDVVVLDLALPDISGQEVFANLRSRGWDVPVIFSSGDQGLIDALRDLPQSNFQVIEKPYNISDLMPMIVGAVSGEPTFAT